MKSFSSVFVGLATSMAFVGGALVVWLFLQSGPTLPHDREASFGAGGRRDSAREAMPRGPDRVGEAVDVARVPAATRPSIAPSPSEAVKDRAAWIRLRAERKSDQDLDELQDLYSKLVDEPGTRELRKQILSAFASLEDQGRADALLRQCVLLERPGFDGDVVLSHAERLFGKLWSSNAVLRDNARADLLNAATPAALRKATLYGLEQVGGPWLSSDLTALYHSTSGDGLHFNAMHLIGRLGTREDAYAIAEEGLSRPSVGGAVPIEVRGAELCLANLVQAHPEERENAGRLLTKALQRTDLTPAYVASLCNTLRRMDPRAYDALPQDVKDRERAAPKSFGVGGSTQK